MLHSSRIIKHIKSSIVGYLALFMVLSGTAYASHLTVFSSDIVDGQVRSVDVQDDGLTGTDIAENTLSVRNMGCQSGKVLGFARIKGTAPIPSSYTSDPAAIDITNNCSGGRIEVRRASTGVYFVRFVGNPAALALAVPNQDGASTAFSGDADNVVTVGKITSGFDAGAFRVDIGDLPGPGATAGGRQNGQFTMMLP